MWCDKGSISFHRGVMRFLTTVLWRFMVRTVIGVIGFWWCTSYAV